MTRLAQSLDTIDRRDERAIMLDRLTGLETRMHALGLKNTEIATTWREQIERGAPAFLYTNFVRDLEAFIARQERERIAVAAQHYGQMAQEAQQAFVKTPVRSTVML